VGETNPLFLFAKRKEVKNLKNKDVVKTVEELLTPMLPEHELDLWDVELVKEGANLYLRVYIDKKEGSIGIDHCEVVSRFLSTHLDQMDPIGNPYILEVSSPGINRTLKWDRDFLRFCGHIVDIMLYKARDKVKEFQGELISYENDSITIKDDKDITHSFDKQEVSICRLAVIF